MGEGVDTARRWEIMRCLLDWFLRRQSQYGRVSILAVSGTITRQVALSGRFGVFMPTTATLSFACLICHLVFYTVPGPWEVLDKVCRANKCTSEI